MAERIKAGDAVLAQDAYGEWLPMVAVTGVEGTHGLRDGKYRKIHDFPCIWVARTEDDEPIPWPAESVRRADDESADA